MRRLDSTTVLYALALCLIICPGCTRQTELEWNREEGHAWAALSPGLWGSDGFDKKAASATGIAFANTVDEADLAENRVLMNGSGVAAGDVDGDGLVDLYFARLEGPNKLYKNMGGLAFKDITEDAGVAHKGYYSTGVTFADVDGDEDADLLVSTLDGGNALYVNDGRGNYDRKEDSGLGPGRGSTTMTLADIDGDRDLDLYVANYKEKDARDRYGPSKITLENITRQRQGGFSLVSPFDRHYRLFARRGGPDARQLGEANELYLNDGEGRFTKVPALGERFRSRSKKSPEPTRGWSLTAAFRDINGDRHPDLYVCNDFWTPDQIWINRGDGSFTPPDSFAFRSTSYSSMGVDFSDINQDGHVDMFVTEMLSPVHERRMRQMTNVTPFVSRAGRDGGPRQYVQNTLQLNRGDHTFAEIAYYAGVEATEWSWATTSLDVDLDGYEDLIVNTGQAYDVQDLDTQERLGQRLARGIDLDQHLLEFPPLELRNVALKNNGDLTFTDVSREWGLVEADVSHGLATADLDNDGDLDLVTNRLNRTAAVYENTTTNSRIAVRLEGVPPNTQGIGARIELKGGPIHQWREIEAGGDYLSGSDPLVVFAAAEKPSSYELVVTWPSGRRSLVDSVRADRIYRVTEPATQRPAPPGGDKQTRPHQFVDVSSRLSHVHHEVPFDDFHIQPLLPLKLSELGPSISWIDVNRDGHDDVLVGADKGGEMGVFLSDGEGRFSPADIEGLSGRAAEDQTAIIGWADAQGQHIVVGSASYERSATRTTAAWHYILEDGRLARKEPLPGGRSATGPLAAADYDGDGDVDLFVGGRFKAGQYPRDATSRLFENVEGSFRPDRANRRTLREIGLVTGSVFTDFDRDGDQDLLLSRAWDSIVLLENDAGVFRDASSDAGLDRLEGRWNGIATGDFNNDGRPDFVATNWGTNSVYQLDSAAPLKIYHDDFDRDGRIDILEAYYNEKAEAYVPRRPLYDVDRSIPRVVRRIRTHRQYARSSIGEILNASIDDLPSKRINMLEHAVFLSTENGFAARPLPPETQLTTAFDPEVADFDHDGHEDLFLSQNFFGQPLMRPRQDAGRGVLLKGDGQGHFEVVPGQVSGIKVYGEQRGAAVSDFNGDAKVDLSVSQNGAPTKLYANQMGKSGLRIRLLGPDENLDGIGSRVRLIYRDGSKGPAREIQAGAGYWSQTSATPVLGVAGRPAAVQVVWFDGTTQKVSFTQTGAEETPSREIVIRYGRPAKQTRFPGHVHHSAP